ncbi:MAG: endo-1,4-beta-xylanase [Clostridia bacterium]|nr:endo-1,4-beta-xylanase [Clostridia bacterium]
MTSIANNLDHRKQDYAFKFVDKNGNPVAGKKVNAKLSNHEFLFGCGAFPAKTLMKMDDPQAAEFGKTRFELMKKIFNYATVHMYWGNFEREEGKPATAFIRENAEFFKENGFKLKGHPLCWHTVCADWLLKYDDETILRKQLERIKRDVTEFKGTIDMWDVINEVVIMPVFDKYDNAVTRICNMKGRLALVQDVFGEARKANPNATLLLNDFNMTVSYEELIAECLEAGVPIDVIGLQSHQHQGYWGAEKTVDVIERFSKFGLPLHFTENTILSGTLVPPEIEDLNDHQVTEWPSTPELEELQSKQLEEMMRIIFSAPTVQGMTYWDFGDGAWLNAPSGLVRKDNSVKPVYNMYDNLVNNEWSTNVDLVTDENGIVKFNGFKGDYIFDVEGKKATSVKTDGSNVATIVIE